MPRFTYIALDATGERRTGTVEAPSREQAESGLIDNELTPIAVEPLKEPTNVEDILARFSGIKPDVLVIFTRQLATIIGAGMTQLQALATLEEQQENPKFKEVVGALTAKVESGEPLYVACAEHPEVFDTLYVSMVEAGEESGSLPQALNELARQLEKQAKLRKAVKSATIYPKVVLIATFLIISGLLMTIVPTFANLYEEIVSSTYSPSSGEPPPSTDLPVPTQIVVGLSHTLYPESEHKDLAWVGQVALRFIGLLVTILLGRKAIQKILMKPEPRWRWDSFKLRAPLRIGVLIKKIVVARFTRTFASLLSSGVQMGKAMEIVSKTSGNVVVGEAIMKARDQMLAGATIAEPLSRSDVFPPMVVRMIEAGEASGQLELMLTKIADYYEEEVDLQIAGLTSMLEPLMIVIVGAAVGAVVIAVYLPMFGIYDKFNTTAMIAGSFASEALTTVLQGLPF